MVYEVWCEIPIAGSSVKIRMRIKQIRSRLLRGTLCFTLHVAGPLEEITLVLIINLFSKSFTLSLVISGPYGPENVVREATVST